MPFYADAVNGNNTTGSGTALAPWKTLQKCLDNITTGDKTIYLKGRFNELNLTPAVAGTLATPISIEKWPDEDGFWMLDCFAAATSATNNPFATTDNWAVTDFKDGFIFCDLFYPTASTGGTSARFRFYRTRVVAGQILRFLSWGFPDGYTNYGEDSAFICLQSANQYSYGLIWDDRHGGAALTAPNYDFTRCLFAGANGALGDGPAVLSGGSIWAQLNNCTLINRQSYQESFKANDTNVLLTSTAGLVKVTGDGNLMLGSAEKAGAFAAGTSLTNSVRAPTNKYYGGERPIYCEDMPYLIPIGAQAWKDALVTVAGKTTDMHGQAKVGANYDIGAEEFQAASNYNNMLKLGATTISGGGGGGGANKMGIGL